MNSSKLAPEVATRQDFRDAANSSNPKLHRKVGVEIVRSANMSKRFFHGPRRQRHSFIWNDNDAWAWRVEAAMR